MFDVVPVRTAISAFASHISTRARLVAGVCMGLLYLGYVCFIAPPLDFIPHTTVSIPRGSAVSDVAEKLVDANIIRRELPLRILFRVLGADVPVRAGIYRFENSQNLFTVAYRLIAGDYGIPPVRLTFFEGETVRVLAPRIAASFPFTTESEFLEKGLRYEGYLFPDTYLLSSSLDTDSILSIMRENFDSKIKEFKEGINASGKSISDIVIMASLVEREARTIESKRMVAGILWNRLEKDMPLQVDAVFGYIFNRDTYHPSLSDLKADSPYNTYLYRGLPPGPISNPGRDSIGAAVYPTKSEYLYYLTGSDNRMHYAKTYAGHQANIRKYLK